MYHHCYTLCGCGRVVHYFVALLPCAQHFHISMITITYHIATGRLIFCFTTLVILSVVLNSAISLSAFSVRALSKPCKTYTNHTLDIVCTYTGNSVFTFSCAYLPSSFLFLKENILKQVMSEISVHNSIYWINI